MNRNGLQPSRPRRALQIVADEAWPSGFREVRIRIDDDIEKVITLRSSARRQKLAAEREQREKEFANARDLVSRINNVPTPSDIHMFFRLWREATGYRAKDSWLRDVLAPGKQALIANILSAAQRERWAHGRRRGPLVNSEYKDVVYVDTPKGQVSFHVRPDAYAILPLYEGQWSGLHNTSDIIASLYEPGGALAVNQYQAEGPKTVSATH